jgi:hypothetical protein
MTRPIGCGGARVLGSIRRIAVGLKGEVLCGSKDGCAKFDSQMFHVEQQRISLGSAVLTKCSNWNIVSLRVELGVRFGLERSDGANVPTGTLSR